MEFLTPAQLVGYLGTSLNVLAAILIARTQRTSGLWWSLVWSGNLAWFVAGIMMHSFAVVVDGLVFWPVHAMGLVRFVRRRRPA